MHSQDKFRRFIVGTICYAAIIALLSVLPARAQNPVPPTAREAASSPAFAAKLHPSTPPAMKKPRASARAGQSSPQDVSYENGPANGTTDAWTINFGYIVSDSFPGGSVSGFDIYVWEIPGDKVTAVDWSVTSAPNGGTVYGSGTVSGASLTDTFISTNQFGYNIDKISATGLSSSGASGTLWLNVFNAAVPSGDPVYWDENSGVGCHSNGCPSQAYESAIGTIASEAFDIGGGCKGGCPSCFQPGGGLQVLHDFNSKQDGGKPSGGVATDAAGNVYGAMSGGSTSFGFVYEIAAKNLGWLFNILYNFTGGSDGGYPNPPIVGPEGVLYGTAGGGCCGLVYSLRPAPTPCAASSCPWTENVIYQFADSASAGSIVAFDQAGNLYGFSWSGGAYGKGTVFELTPSPGGWKETILYSFTGGSDGGAPNSLLVGKDGNLYGAGGGGGAYGLGVIFQLGRPLSGSNWAENVIYNFTGQDYSFRRGSDGGAPADLVQDGLGNLLGFSSYSRLDDGGYHVYLVLFMVSPSNGSWVFRALGNSDIYGLDRWDSGLATDAAGNVYRATGLYGKGCLGIDCSSPEDYAEGDVYMTSPGGQNWSTLWGTDTEFFPNSPLSLDANHNVYGTTSNCGKYGQGTIWQVTN